MSFGIEQLCLGSRQYGEYAQKVLLWKQRGNQEMEKLQGGKWLKEKGPRTLGLAGLFLLYVQAETASSKIESSHAF